MSVTIRLSKKDRNVKWVFTLAIKGLTKQLRVLPSNVSFPATDGSCEFEGLGATQSRGNG